MKITTRKGIMERSTPLEVKPEKISRTTSYRVVLVVQRIVEDSDGRNNVTENVDSKIMAVRESHIDAWDYFNRVFVEKI